MADNKDIFGKDFVDPRLIEKGLIGNDFFDYIANSGLTDTSNPPLGGGGERRAELVVGGAVLSYFLKKYEGRIALSSSLSIEDQALTHMIVKINPKTRIFTLDTGRLFPQTYQLIDRTNLTYNIKIEVFFPDYHEVQKMVKEEGINLFYNSIESRHRCCAIRKLEPLKRAFQGLDVWICGLRHQQSVTRKNMHLVEWDDIHNMIKLNPLINWTEDEVRDYIHKNHVPYNKLFDQGYPSIGCEPCTRAVKPGEDPRSGRWWWEAPDKRECGLHQRY